ncbi:MAG: hypothetical protein RI101_12995 [Nitrospira sp.]|nr:hypothetical protein [Nitrospira sp.]
MKSPSPAVLFLLSAFILFSSGCVARNAADDMQKRMQERARLRALEPTYLANYDVLLSEVQRPQDAQARFGELKISQVDTGKGRIFQAEDQLLRIVWTGPDAQLGFELLNKVDGPFKILWDETAYVDIGGQTHRVIHSGVKLVDRNSPQPPSVIPSKGRLSDMAYSSDNVTFSQYGGWSQMPMFPCTREGYVCNDLNRKLVTAHTGLDYRVLLPIQVGKDTFPYTFVFRVVKGEVLTIPPKGEPQTKPEAAH